MSAREARQLGAALISHTCARTRQLELTSYDRLFSNQTPEFYFMQYRPIRHRAGLSDTSPHRLEVWPQELVVPVIPDDAVIQEVFRLLAGNRARNDRIAKDIVTAYQNGRNLIVLSERTGHLLLLREAIGASVDHCFLLHGRMGKKQRAAVLGALEGLDAQAPRVLLATGRLVGEGFDHPPLDTLVLAMPIAVSRSTRAIRNV